MAIRISTLHAIKGSYRSWWLSKRCWPGRRLGGKVNGQSPCAASWAHRDMVARLRSRWSGSYGPRGRATAQSLTVINFEVPYERLTYTVPPSAQAAHHLAGAL